MGQKFYDETNVQAIADAIRAKTGGTSAMTVAQMSAAIQNISIGSSNSVCFTATLSENTTGEVVLNADGNASIAAHYTETNFTATIMYLGEASESALLCTTASNHRLRSDSSPNYGITLRATGTGVTSFFVSKAVSAASTRIGGTITVNASGVVSVYGTTTIPLIAGEYLVICGW